MEKQNQEMLSAMVRGKLDAVKELVAQGMPLNQPFYRGRMPLHYAVEEGRTAIAQFLIEQGADVNGRAEPDSRWSGAETPLMLAARRGRVEAARALIAAGADVNPSARSGATALVDAAGEKGTAWTRIVQDLIWAGAEVGQQSPNGLTALIWAARHASPETIRVLVAAGADVNAVTGWGTALARAVAEERADNVAALLEAGADPNAQVPADLTDKALAGKTPRELAKELRQKKILALLVAAALGQRPAAERPRPAVSAADVPSLWKRIDKALRTRAPGVKQSLKRGASDKRIGELEARCGVTLPEDFKASLRVHDGQDGDGEALIPSVFTDDEYELLRLQEIASEWDSWKGLVDAGEFAADASAPDEGIRSDWWHPGWIPFASNGRGDSLCIDLAPTAAGVAGQVISMNHETAQRRHLAPSFAEFLKQVAEQLEDDSAH
jgi:cell wall assembly regulator SMI1/ankyrin repeat protein